MGRSPALLIPSAWTRPSARGLACSRPLKTHRDPSDTQAWTPYRDSQLPIRPYHLCHGYNHSPCRRTYRRSHHQCRRSARSHYLGYLPRLWHSPSGLCSPELCGKKAAAHLLRFSGQYLHNLCIWYCGNVPLHILRNRALRPHHSGRRGLLRGRALPACCRMCSALYDVRDLDTRAILRYGT